MAALIRSETGTSSLAGLGAEARPVLHERYQDYVIRDGRLVGDFEGMYRDHADPWGQERDSTDRAIALNLLERVGAKRVLELGSGLGVFTDEIRRAGFDVLGVDVSQTAVDRARASWPECRFVAGDVLDRWVYDDFRPDVIVMAQVTWYVLDKLDEFLSMYRGLDAYLLHMLVTYPAGVQKYGREKFVDAEGIRRYFGLRYLEWGESVSAEEGTTRTYFLAKAR